MPSLPTHTTRRHAAALLAFAGSAAAGAPASAAPASAAPALPATPEGTPRDFDFEHGRWQTTLRRLLKPLSGSQDWAEYGGTTLVRPVLDGRANLVELDVCGPHGRLQGLSLRLFEPRQRRWTLNFANAASGELATPMAGGFGGGPRGLFYSAEALDGRSILARFVIESVSADRCGFEQAFSADGGATWEVNWVAVDTRVGAAGEGAVRS